MVQRINPPDLRIHLVDRPEQLGEARTLVNGPQAIEAGSQYIQVAAGEQTDRDNALV
jgi:hypothetical protein